MTNLIILRMYGLNYMVTNRGEQLFWIEIQGPIEFMLRKVAR